MQALSVETHMDESTAKRIAALYAWLVLGQQEMLNFSYCCRLKFFDAHDVTIVDSDRSGIDFLPVKVNEVGGDDKR